MGPKWQVPRGTIWTASTKANNTHTLQGDVPSGDEVLGGLCHCPSHTFPQKVVETKNKHDMDKVAATFAISKEKLKQAVKKVKK